MRLYGTLGPACCGKETLRALLQEGMRGMRLNLSHGLLAHRLPWIEALREAGAAEGIFPELILDTQGPELRIGALSQPMVLVDGQRVTLGEGAAIPLDPQVAALLTEGVRLLLDDGKLLAQVEATEDGRCRAVVLRGGVLSGRKSLAVEGLATPLPAVCAADRENLRQAAACGVTGLMQPFVRSADDLTQVRTALRETGVPGLRIFAKIENQEGLQQLPALLAGAEEFVIARGDLGNAMPLWELPAAQKQVAAVCRRAGKDFMVVTQLLDSMQHSPVPTRAEVLDVYNAVLDGATSLLLTAETAVGQYPVEAMGYLRRIAGEGESAR